MQKFYTQKNLDQDQQILTIKGQIINILGSKGYGS